MTDKTFKQFLRESWKSYLYPVLAPLVVFAISFFATNIGWRAFPAALIVVAIMSALTTFTLYNRYWVIEHIIKDIKATGRTIKIPPE